MRPGRIARRSVIFLLTGLVGLSAFVLGRAACWPSRQLSVTPVNPIKLDEPVAVERLAAAIRFATVSDPVPRKVDATAFKGLHRHLEGAFPRVGESLTREVVAGLSLLYIWPGADPSLRPILITAHQDVVPVEAGTEASWTHPPFGGVVGDGFIWGRGSLDMKGSLVACLEATEALLVEGFRPNRTILFAFGHDEEVGGTGAACIEALLRERSLRPEIILDEGGAITEGIVPGVARPVAVVGVAEKSLLNVELSAPSTPGHSSMPPPQTAVGIVAAAVAALERNPMPASLDGPAGLLFDSVGPEMNPPMRTLFANRWLFGGLILRQMAGSPATNATVRTTSAATIIRGGETANVLPASARAVINFRLKPGDTPRLVLDHIRAAIDDDRVRVRALPGMGSSPSRVSPVDSHGYRALERSIREVRPGTIVAPGLTVTSGDSRHFADTGADIYRLLPYTFRGSADTRRIHGIDERIAIADYLDAVRLYARFFRNAAGDATTADSSTEL